MNRKLITLILFLLILLPFVSAELSSTNYKIATYAIAGGGTNVTSSSYKTDFVLGDIARNITSNLYKLYLGFFYSTIADVTDPIVEFAGGTAADATRPKQDYIYVNVSVTEDNFRSITFSLRNSTATVNTTTYITQTYSINWTILPGEDYWYNVTVEDIASNTGTISRELTLIESESNISLNTGWNLLSLVMEANDTATDRNITLVADGWTLIGHSADTAFSIDNTNFIASDGTNYSWANAIANNKVYGYLSYWDSSPTLAKDRKFKYATLSTLNMDDSNLQPKTGYWVYAWKAGKLNLPSSGGTLADETYAWNKLRFHNGTDELNITDAHNAIWINKNLQYYDSSAGGFKWIYEGIPFYLGKETISSWEGIFVYGYQDNITLIRQN